jgi:hypothetical protein
MIILFMVVILWLEAIFTSVCFIWTYNAGFGSIHLDINVIWQMRVNVVILCAVNKIKRRDCKVKDTLTFFFLYISGAQLTPYLHQLDQRLFCRKRENYQRGRDRLPFRMTVYCSRNQKVRHLVWNQDKEELKASSKCIITI